MKVIVSMGLALLLTACARTPAPVAAVFTVDQYLAIALEYQGPRSVAGVDTYGPTPKEFDCERSDAAGIAQSDDLLPHSHTLVTTCLHVRFGGPLPKGAVAVLPAVRETVEYVTIGVEYGAEGEFVGAKALHFAPDRMTCLKEARDVVRSNYRDGHVEADESLLLYCVPVPAIDAKPKDEGGVV